MSLICLKLKFGEALIGLGASIVYGACASVLRLLVCNSRNLNPIRKIVHKKPALLTLHCGDPLVLELIIGADFFALRWKDRPLMLSIICSVNLGP